MNAGIQTRFYVLVYAYEKAWHLARALLSVWEACGGFDASGSSFRFGVWPGRVHRIREPWSSVPSENPCHRFSRCRHRDHRLWSLPREDGRILFGFRYTTLSQQLLCQPRFLMVGWGTWYHFGIVLSCLEVLSQIRFPSETLEHIRNYPSLHVVNHRVAYHDHVERWITISALLAVSC